MDESPTEGRGSGARLIYLHPLGRPSLGGRPFSFMDIQTERTLQQIADNFRQFSRNGRWGTCGGCLLTDHND